MRPLDLPHLGVVRRTRYIVSPVQYFLQLPPETGGCDTVVN
jgi:hypothetical protein